MVLCAFCDREPSDRIHRLWLCERCHDTAEYYALSRWHKRWHEALFETINVNPMAEEATTCLEAFARYFKDAKWSLFAADEREDATTVEGLLIKDNIAMTFMAWCYTRPEL
jgi:hypothetical protein